jgi:pimeloyl-ACP methyl ester carboxylesterase
MAASPTAAPPTEPDRGRALYHYGATTVFAARSDPRFAYCLYVPPDLERAGVRPELVVAMHGTGRSFIQYRDAFAGFARWNNCLVLAPLFPVGVLGDGNRSGFKYMAEGDIRYDAVLLSMVAEVEERYRVAFPRFALFGYSGGAHFAHRFLYLHPDRLWAVSVGAPGSVTLPDATRDWWVGVRDLSARFGIPFDPAAVARVPVQIVVGEVDLETWEITHREGGPYWMPGANDAGRTRPERAGTLARALEALGAPVRLNRIPNMAHDGAKAVDTVQAFLAEILDGLRAQGRRGAA